MQARPAWPISSPPFPNSGRLQTSPFWYLFQIKRWDFICVTCASHLDFTGFRLDCFSYCSETHMSRNWLAELLYTVLIIVLSAAIASVIFKCWSAEGGWRRLKAKERLRWLCESSPPRRTDRSLEWVQAQHLDTKVSFILIWRLFFLIWNHNKPDFQSLKHYPSICLSKFGNGGMFWSIRWGKKLRFLSPKKEKLMLRGLSPFISPSIIERKNDELRFWFFSLPPRHQEMLFEGLKWSLTHTVSSGAVWPEGSHTLLCSVNGRLNMAPACPRTLFSHKHTHSGESM